MSVYEKNLEKNKANFVPLTPLTFLVRAKEIYPNYEAVIYEDRNYTWSEVYKRCVKFASALSKIGIKKGDTVSFLAFNTFTTFAYCSTSSSFPFFGKCRLHKHEVLRVKLFSMSHCGVHSFYFLVYLISFAPFLRSHHSPMLHS